VLQVLGADFVVAQLDAPEELRSRVPDQLRGYESRVAEVRIVEAGAPIAEGGGEVANMCRWGSTGNSSIVSCELRCTVW
jgi:hypothetical protein